MVREIFTQNLLITIFQRRKISRIKKKVHSALSHFYAYFSFFCDYFIVKNPLYVESDIQEIYVNFKDCRYVLGMFMVTI